MRNYQVCKWNFTELSTSPLLWHILLFDTSMHHSCGTGQDLSGRRRSVASLRCQATNQHSSDNADRFKEAAAQSTSAYHQRPVPWAITFDIRERETIWTDENKVRQPTFTTVESSAVQSPRFYLSMHPALVSSSQACVDVAMSLHVLSLCSHPDWAGHVLS